jgi:hypothetical protein
MIRTAMTSAPTMKYIVLFDPRGSRGLPRLSTFTMRSFLSRETKFGPETCAKELRSRQSAESVADETYAGKALAAIVRAGRPPLGLAEYPGENRINVPRMIGEIELGA